MSGILLLVLLVLLVVYFIFVYNRLTMYNVEADNAWKQIDVQLKRRYDLIPNLVEIAKGYLKHEQDTLVKVMEARNKAVSSKSIGDTIKAEGELTGLLKQLSMVVERYPDLKANQNMLKLQDELTSTENKISYSRAHYNDVVANYTYLQRKFPSNYIASSFKFQSREYFNVPDTDKETPKVKF
jgi:LemA protein